MSSSPHEITGKAWKAGFLLVVVLAAPVYANTPGRAWAPTEMLQSSLGPLISPRLEVDSVGKPFIFGSMAFGTNRNDVGFTWNGTTWIETWHVGRGLAYNWPVWAPPNEFYVVGQDPKVGSKTTSLFWLARKIGDNFLLEDVAMLSTDRSDYGAAVATQRRWVVVNDGAFVLRLYLSDQMGSWTEIPTGQGGGGGVGIAALDDTTAILAWGRFGDGIRWATVRGQSWIQGSPLLIGAYNPSFAKRPDGGYWMGCASQEPHVYVHSYLDGIWDSTPRVITANYRLPISLNSRTTDSFDIGRGGGSYPPIAWSAFDANHHVEAICVSVPMDSGWTVADQLENDQEGILPTVARDANGDVWVAYWRRTMTGLFISHTYTKATSNVPSISDEATGRLVTWVLSEPSPETWWAVLRSDNGGPFNPVARVRAGAIVNMSWLDETPPTDSASYRIRRECVDTRLEWLSDPSDVPVPALASIASVSAEPGVVTLSWYASDPNVSLTVYRRTVMSDWVSVGSTSTEGNGLLTFIDRTVSEGRYAYRLGFGDVFTSETWVDVPTGFTFGLAGFAQNPASGTPQVAFSLPNNSPATLELYSVAGRRIRQQEVGPMGAGNHVFTFERRADLPAGVYWIQVRQSGQAITRKGVLTN